MPAIEEAIEALRIAVHRKGVDRHVKDAFSHVTSCLVLLNSSAPSLQAINKLRSVLRQPLLPLYEACLQPTLELSSVVLSKILEKLCDAHNLDDAGLRAGWDATADETLSGVLDFLEQKPDGDDKCKVVLGEILYPVICKFFFPEASQDPPTFSIPLCLSAYSSLTETLGQVSNQEALRDKVVLGGERLATAISRSRDYLLIEALLTLFAQLIPPTNHTALGKFRRTKFVREVLGSPKLFECSSELLDIMHKISSTHWDDTAAQIIDALARSDITYPQPFSVAEIDVCGRVFPQPTETDRLIMDRQGFLANVILENDDPCESLQVPYAHIRMITIDNSRETTPKGKTMITMDLTSPSLVANMEMKLPAGSSLYAKFLLESDVLSKFMEALRRRGVGKLSFVNSPPKMAKPRQSISLASGFRFTDSSSPLPPPASFEDKVKHVKEVYQTDTEDPTTTDFTPVLDLGNVISLPSPGSKPATKNEGLQAAGLHSLVNENPSNTTKKDKTTVSLTIRTKSPPRRGAVAHSSRESSAKAMQVSVFGESDEQLSEIPDIEPENGTLKQPHSTPAPRRGREKKATLAATAIPGSPVPTRKPPKRTIKRKRIIDSDDEVSGTSVVNGSKEPAKTTSKIKDDAEGTVGNPLETEKPPSTRDSSEPNPSIDFSAPLEADFLIPTLPLTGTEVASRQGTASDGFTVSDPNAPTAPGVVDGGHCNARPVFDSSTKEPISLSSSGGKIEQHSSRRVPAAGVVRNEACSPAKPSEETGPPPRIAGSRRKREDTKPSDELAAVDAEDEPAPQKKKSREARNEEPGEMPDKDPSGQRLSSSGPVITNSVRLTKRYGKNTKASPVSAGPTVVNFDELPKESKPTRSSTRRMGKFKEKLTTPTRGTRTTAMRGKDGKPANARLTTTVKSDAVSLKETSVQISRAAVATRKDHSSLNSSTLVHDMARVYTSKAENIVPEAKLNVVQEAPKAIAVQPHKSNRASAKAKKAPWEDPKFAQHVSSDPIPPESEVEVHVKKEIPNAELLVAGFDAMSNDVIQSDDVIEYSTPLKGGSEDLVELACDLPTKRSTPGKEAVTIDLTRDDSPVQKKPQVLKASAPPVEAAPASSETEVRATMRASDRFVCADIQDVTCELTLPPSPPRRKRLSVTFASPVEHPVPDDATPELTKTRPKGPRLAGTRSVQTQTVTDYLGSPTDTTPSSRLLSVSKDHALSPLGVPRMFANDTPGQSISSWVTPQQSKVYLSNKGTRIAPIPVAHEPISDEVEIQDIVDVLNDIQDVIIEGVSKRFKNVKNHVRAVRDRFMQQALDDLQDMAIENAKHFNGLVSLEEEYHKYRKTSAHRWEELIDCNESISAHFQHALKEHDQNMSAKMFPKSLLPEKPLFPSRRQKV